MINGKKIAVVMPAYNAARTLEQTVRELPVVVLCSEAALRRNAKPKSC